jgi:hypothetical protein
MNGVARLKGRMRAASAALLAMAAVATGSCRDAAEPNDPSGPDPDFHPIPQLLVSNPVPSGAEARAAGDQVAYVSILPGALPKGLAATITNGRTGASRTETLVEGGLDPVAIGAVVGDTIVVAIDTGGARPLRSAKVVPEHESLVVVRTEPVRGKVDVTLDTRVVVVFSEPLDPSSVTAETARLEQAGSRVTAGVEVSSDALMAAFIPSADLLPDTDYTIVLTGVRGVDGTGLGSDVVVGFRTSRRTPLPRPDSFPPAPASALTYNRANEHTIPSGARSRYVLYEDSSFALQYLQSSGFFEYTGRYSRASERIDFDFDGSGSAGPWQATGTIRGDSLVITYNLLMQLDDFENGVYVLAPTPLAFTWPAAAWSCPLPTHIELLRLSDGQVTRLAEGSLRGGSA